MVRFQQFHVNENVRKIDWVYRLIVKTVRPITYAEYVNQLPAYRTQFFYSLEDLQHYLKFTNEEVVEVASAAVGDFYKISHDFLERHGH